MPDENSANYILLSNDMLGQSNSGKIGYGYIICVNLLIKKLCIVLNTIAQLNDDRIKH